MTKRLMAIVESSSDDGPYRARAKVYRDTEWNEWRVRYYHGEELLSYLGAEADSFHDDQADAMGTAEMQVRQLAKQEVPGARRDNPSDEVKPKTLDAFKAQAVKFGYTVQKRSSPRIGDFYLANDANNEPVGSFCLRHSRDAWLLKPADFAETRPGDK